MSLLRLAVLNIGCLLDELHQDVDEETAARRASLIELVRELKRQTTDQRFAASMDFLIQSLELDGHGLAATITVSDPLVNELRSALADYTPARGRSTILKLGMYDAIARSANGREPELLGLVSGMDNSYLVEDTLFLIR